MFVFIAGASRIGLRSASTNDVRKSSAIPCASLAMMLAVAGAISSRSISVVSAMCSMSAFMPGAH